MIGSLNLPIAKGNAKTYVFTANDGTLDPTSAGTRGVGHTTWQKPAGINFVYGLLISPGAGGGGGFSFGAGTVGGGGGGGAPGAVTQFVQPAYLMPDTIIVTVGRGGRGGSAGIAGSSNNYATSLYYRTKVLGNINFGANSNTIYAGTNSYYGGTIPGRAGSAIVQGVGGTAGGALTSAQMPGIGGVSNFVIYSAPGGFSGGYISAGNNATFLGRPQGGAGGGGVSSSIAYAGGNALGPSTSEQSIWSRNLSGGANTGVAGEDGITLLEPTFFTLPGTGGGATLSGTGGRGGKGGIGCGGGGGGAGPTGGAGGDGGDGLAILVCW